jgi:urease gamma subunit
MQEQTKIQLSQPEQQLMLNAEWILTKNSVMDKMNRLLQECQEGQL